MGDNELGSELTGLIKQNNKKTLLGKKALIGIISGVSVVIIIILIFILTVSLSGKKSKKNKIGEINCIYNVEKISENTVILGPDFKKKTNFDISIDGNIIKYSKEYKFKEYGYQNVQYIIYEDLDMDYMFQNIQNLISVEMISEKNAGIKSMRGTFEYCVDIEKIKMIGFDTSQVKSMSRLFYGMDLPDQESFQSIQSFLIDLDTKNVEDMSYMFALSNFRELNLSSFDTRKVINMSHMFEGCYSMNYINFEKMNTSQVKDMSYMFQSCEALNYLDLSNFNTEKVTDMSHMFRNCITIRGISLSNFKTSSVIDLSAMFANCNYLLQIDISNFDTSNVKNMSQMFEYCGFLSEIDVSKFNTKNVDNYLSILNLLYNNSVLYLISLFIFSILIF